MWRSRRRVQKSFAADTCPTPDRSRDGQKSPPSPLTGPVRGPRGGKERTPPIWPTRPVRAHLAGRDDGLVRVKPLLDRAPHFADLIRGRARRGRLRPDQARAELIGRPLGSVGFVEEIENRLGRVLAPGKCGRRVTLIRWMSVSFSLTEHSRSMTGAVSGSSRRRDLFNRHMALLRLMDFLNASMHKTERKLIVQ